jgi:hypothetical protein
MNKKLFYYTLVISIFVQILTGLIDIGAFFVNVPADSILIRQLLLIELIVQIIESGFYFWLAFHFKKLSNITPKR